MDGLSFQWWELTSAAKLLGDRFLLPAPQTSNCLPCARCFWWIFPEDMKRHKKWSRPWWNPWVTGEICKFTVSCNVGWYRFPCTTCFSCSHLVFPKVLMGLLASREENPSLSENWGRGGSRIVYKILFGGPVVLICPQEKMPYHQPYCSLPSDEFIWIPLEGKIIWTPVTRYL